MYYLCCRLVLITNHVINCRVIKFGTRSFLLATYPVIVLRSLIVSRLHVVQSMYYFSLLPSFNNCNDDCLMRVSVASERPCDNITRCCRFIVIKSNKLMASVNGCTGVLYARKFDQNAQN